jgi:signal transduction histidine kinase/DNA-binding response OmpR family regulator
MIPEWVAAHRRGEWIHIPCVASLPTDSYLWQVLAPQGIRSLITLPLILGAECLGFVGFDAVADERNWREEEVAILRVLAELYAHFEARRAMELETQALQQRLTLARDAAQAAAHAKSLFLANMSHEIRTPLNAILGYAQIMGRECLARACPMVNKLGAITRSGEHLLVLLTDLLELVRSDSNELTLSISPFDFYQALEDVRLIFAKHLASQSLKMDVSCASNVPQFICSDSGKVRQILLNLLGNALKFTENGSIRLSIAVLPGEVADGITLAVDVEDTGCGIRPEEVKHLFELFYTQADQGHKAARGTGLGLPLSQRYARALGGDIVLTRSTPGEGSCFRFTFRTHVADSASVEQKQKGVVSRLAPDQPPCRILVVDDDPANREMLSDMLEAVGGVVETASSAAIALHRLRQHEELDLVLMDKRMPEMDGYEAIRHMRAIPGCEKLSVFVVTASGLADEHELALAAGADGYISKPIHREKLLEEISRVTGIQYEYEPSSSGISVENEFPVLDAEALLRLPAEIRYLIKQALKRGDIQQLRDLVETIALDQIGIANGIRILVNAYDYGRLRNLIESAERNPG